MIEAWPQRDTLGARGFPNRVCTAGQYDEVEEQNAVRAAFKAGVKPPQIARQVGLCEPDVRKALASDVSR
jgi:hypothetical protein